MFRLPFQVCFDLLPSGDPEGFLFCVKKLFFPLSFSFFAV